MVRPQCLLLYCVQLADPWELAKDMLLQGSVVDGIISGFNKGWWSWTASSRVRGGAHERGGGYEVELNGEAEG
jgi:hypothetical protein